MSESAVAERYARAIFELGQETGKLAQLSDDFQNFGRAYAASADLRAVLVDPAVGEEQRTAIVRTLGSKLAMGQEALNAVRLLVSRRRVAAIGQIAERLALLMDAKSGLLRVTVTSAKRLSDVYCQRLIATVEGATGKKVILEKAEDPSLVAGVVTQIGDHTVDGTLKGRMQRLERELLGAS